MNGALAGWQTTRWPGSGGTHMALRMRRRLRVRNAARRPGAMSDAFAGWETTGRCGLIELQVMARLYTRPGDGVTVP